MFLWQNLLCRIADTAFYLVQQICSLDFAYLGAFCPSSPFGPSNFDSDAATEIQKLNIEKKNKFMLICELIFLKFTEVLNVTLSHVSVRAGHNIHVCLKMHQNATFS